MRHHKVVVTDAGGTPLYCMGWSKNNPVKLDKNDSLIQMHLSNYWEYSGEDDRLYRPECGTFLCGKCSSTSFRLTAWKRSTIPSMLSWTRIPT
jgi:hypothetical protein